MSTISNQEQIDQFQDLVWKYYKNNGRHDLPWRQPTKSGEINAYQVLVSELMLQQTQVKRVIPKFHEFLSLFPTVEALTKASLSEVLVAWSGLGYNRRAKFLYEAAAKIMKDFDGVVPNTATGLISLPGVGSNTAAAIMAYSYNEPVAFIETNIRTVFIHHFFKEDEEVTDTQLLPYIKASVDASDPRQWYWALMDYGSYLKSKVVNPSRKSKHHVQQSKFEGSRRQIRGKVLRILQKQSYTFEAMSLEISDSRLKSVLEDLVNEQLISVFAGAYNLGK